MTTNYPIPYFDVVIIGGGSAGTATALMLRQHSPTLSVALVEKSGYEKMRIGETLPPGVQSLLEHLAVWEAFLEEGHLPAYGTRSAWGSEDLFENEFIFHRGGKGWHLDRRRFDALLAREATQQGVTLYTNTYLQEHCRASEDKWHLTLRTREGQLRSLETAFVVDATGRSAVFARHQGVQKVVFDELLGVFVLFSCNQTVPHWDSYTLVETWEQGWWYSSPLPENQLIVVCMSDVDIVKSLQLKSSEQWFTFAKKTKHTKERIVNTTPQSLPSIAVAHSQHLDRSIGNGWLAVGDAASSFDPISGQGIFKSLRSGIYAAYGISDYFQGKEPGLAKYEAFIAREFEEYLEMYRDYYFQEQRWTGSSFLKRRQIRD